jgi:hypothetical protein
MILRIKFINPLELSAERYIHIPFCVLSFSSDAFILYMLFVKIIGAWGECARNTKEQEQREKQQ